MAKRWKRSIWMRLGALHACCAAMILMLVQPVDALARASQIQFMHGMATIACCTFMGVGGAAARRAPKFFQLGILAYCIPAWSAALAKPWPSAGSIQGLGMALLLAGWITLACAGRTIDANAAA